MILAICHEGYVISPSDGNRHFISSHKVAHLFNIPPQHVIFCHCFSSEIKHALNKRRADLHHLYPRSNGNYKLPEELKDKLRFLQRYCTQMESRI